MRQPRCIDGKRVYQALMLVCLLMNLALAGWSQTPSLPPQASPSPALESLPPVSGATPTVAQSLPSGQQPLVLPSPQSDRKVLSDWRSDGTVGESSFVDNVRKVTWALAMVCFAIWAVSKVVGRATLQKWGLPVEPNSMIELLEKKRLSPGRSIMLLRVGPKVLAVAATESGYTTLTELDAEELKKFRDETAVTAVEPTVAGPHAQTPTDIAKHYLSIIPGLGAKK